MDPPPASAPPPSSFSSSSSAGVGAVASPMEPQITEQESRAAMQQSAIHQQMRYMQMLQQQQMLQQAQMQEQQDLINARVGQKMTGPELKAMRMAQKNVELASIAQRHSQMVAAVAVVSATVDPGNFRMSGLDLAKRAAPLMPPALMAQLSAASGAPQQQQGSGPAALSGQHTAPAQEADSASARGEQQRAQHQQQLQQQFYGQQAAQAQAAQAQAQALQRSAPGRPQAAPAQPGLPSLPLIDPRSVLLDAHMAPILEANGLLLKEAYELNLLGAARSEEQSARQAEVREQLRRRFSAMEQLAVAASRPIVVPKDAIRALFPVDPVTHQAVPPLPPVTAALVYRDDFVVARTEAMRKRGLAAGPGPQAQMSQAQQAQLQSMHAGQAQAQEAQARAQEAQQAQSQEMQRAQAGAAGAVPSETAGGATQGEVAALSPDDGGEQDGGDDAVMEEPVVPGAT